MTFKPSVPQNTNTNSDSSSTSNVDYDALQNHVIECAGTQDKHRTITGFIGGYYSLGKQEQKPFEAIYDETHKDFANWKKFVEEGKATVYTGNINVDGTWHNDVEIYSKPRPPREAIALGIYFPQITVDKARFLEGKSDPRPLMLVMGGETFVKRKDDSGKNEKVIQYPTFIQETTNNPSGTWGLGQTTTLHKMGNALGLLNEHNLLKVDRLGELLGKPLQFRMRVWNKPTKSGGTWYTEEVKFVSEVPEGLTPPEFDESYVHGINFDQPNDPDTVKNLRSDVVNTIRRAINFEGSVIEKELKEYRSQASQQGQSSSEGNQSFEESKPVKEAPVNTSTTSNASASANSLPDFDEDIPFAPLGLQEGNHYLMVI